MEWGDPSAPAVMCMHGVTSHALRFRRVAEWLAPRFRVVSVDLRGHGHSDWEPPWDLDTHVGDLLETADSLGIERADWMGHSFGGRLALERPDELRHVVELARGVDACLRGQDLLH